MDISFCFGLICGIAICLIGYWLFPKAESEAKVIYQDAANEVSHLKESAESCVKQVEYKFATESGEFKAAQAYRMMLNIHPNEIGKDLRLALELAVRKCV